MSVNKPIPVVTGHFIPGLADLEKLNKEGKGFGQYGIAGQGQAK
jgi:hypothetical protein